MKRPELGVTAIVLLEVPVPSVEVPVPSVDVPASSVEAPVSSVEVSPEPLIGFVSSIEVVSFDKFASFVATVISEEFVSSDVVAPHTSLESPTQPNRIGDKTITKNISLLMFIFLHQLVSIKK